MGEVVTLEMETAAGVATIRLHRPPMNAINRQMLDELDEVVGDIAQNDTIRAVVLWGGPKIFAAGADISQFPELGRAEAAELSRHLNATFSRFARLPKVTVAAVCGFALGGGCELAMCADFRVVADDARFGQPEILLGIIPGAGGTQRLTRLVGVSRAKELVYSGRQVGSDEALAIGLASEVHPADVVYERSLEMAARFAAGPAALANAKAAIDGGLNMDIDAALELEEAEFAASFDTADAGIGVGSFLEEGPGKAKFTGR